MHRNRRSFAALSLGIALLAACDRDTPVAPYVTEVPSLSEATLPQPAARGGSMEVERPQEAEFHRLSREIDGYGGHFLDEQGNLVVYLTDPAEAERARGLVAPLLDVYPLSAREASPASRGSIVVRQADYRFAQLADWRDRATGDVLRVTGVVFTDLDEARNRFVVGVSNDAARGAVARVLRTHGVPGEAVAFEETAPTVPLNLQDRNRPLRGGLQIATSAGICTLGFNVRLPGRSGIVTNSHCTHTFWGRDPLHLAMIGQPLMGNPLDRIGREFADPGPGFCWFFPCRNSDAALIEIYYPQDADFAHITRTMSWATGPGNAGSTMINPANPRMRIIAEQPAPIAGQTLDKIGRTTGWTYGRVERTCADAWQDANLLVCQDFIGNMHIDRGDSGSPVFVWHPNYTVTLAGIAWGFSTPLFGGPRSTIMSNMRQVRLDLGPMSTF